MQQYPMLSEVRVERDMIREFKGLNHNLHADDKEFYDMGNMSSSLYPIASPRGPRGKLLTLSKPNGLFAHEKLAWVDGTSFYYNGVLRGSVEDSPKQFCAMGAYILIWPDKVAYNTSTDEFMNLGNHFASTGTVSLTLCKRDGTAYSSYTVSGTAPVSPADGALWMDTSSTPHVLKQYSTASSLWVAIATTYVKIDATGIDEGFAAYDGVTLSGFTNTAFNGSFLLEAVGTDYIVVTGILDAYTEQAAAVTVERKIPDMDFFTESENRIWGCSSANHEIYACKQGDAKNWYSYAGIATDSYTMTVGAPGAFTGTIAHLGYVLFFMEDRILKVYGTKPKDYRLDVTNARGVQKGSEKSLVIVNEVLFYKARGGVCAYASELPAGISLALGPDDYYNAVAGAFGDKYYISMQDGAGVWHLFVYDALRGLWHREDNTQVKYFARVGGELYFVAEDTLYSVGGSLDYGTTPTTEGKVKWYAETGNIGLKQPDHKYVRQVQLRLEAQGLVYISVKYDSYGAWQELYRIEHARMQSISLPILPHRCDTMRIRFSGEGVCRLHSLTKSIESGSDL